MNAPRTVCPVWCNPSLHGDHPDYLVHHSDPRYWQVDGGDAPAFMVQLVRHDELAAPWPDNIGVVSFEMTVTSGPGAIAGGPGADGFLSPNQMRALATWLIEQAGESDPFLLDGEPVEWHQQLAGCSR